MKSLANLDHLLMTLDVAVQDLELLEIETDVRIPPAPPQAITILHPLRGALGIEIPDRPPRICSTGTMVLVPPRIETRLFDANGAGELRIMSGVAMARFSSGFGLLDKARVPIVEDLSDSELVRPLCEAMIEDAVSASHRLGAAAMSNALMKVVIVTVLRRFFRRPGIDQKIISSLADPRLAGAVALILDQPGAAHSVATLASEAGLGRSTFARLFSEALGLSPMEFVVKARLFKAADLLRSGEMPIKSIASKVGFSSRSHFSRAFSDAYGIDPSAYRQNNNQREKTPEPRRLAEIEVGTPTRTKH